MRQVCMIIDDVIHLMHVLMKCIQVVLLHARGNKISQVKRVESNLRRMSTGYFLTLFYEN